MSPMLRRRGLNRSTRYGMIRSGPATTDAEQGFMQTAVSIFVNGITGVFIGIAVLYVAMKVIALTSTMRAGPDKPG